MLKFLAIGTGGFIGAIARYAVSGWVHRTYSGLFPAGTLTVNVIGCFLLGCLMFYVDEGFIMSANLRLFLGVGILGAFTTFSTFGYESIELVKQGQVAAAIAYLLANVLLGCAGVWLAGAVLKLIYR